MIKSMYHSTITRRFVRYIITFALVLQTLQIGRCAFEKSTKIGDFVFRYLWMWFWIRFLEQFQAPGPRFFIANVANEYALDSCNTILPPKLSETINKHKKILTKGSMV